MLMELYFTKLLYTKLSDFARVLSEITKYGGFL